MSHPHEPDNDDPLLASAADAPVPHTLNAQAERRSTMHLRQGELEASRQLCDAFLSGKLLYIGQPEPYQFVTISEMKILGLRRASCRCPEHLGQEGIHELNPSEVTLVLEYGSERVWAFISISARYIYKYQWLSTVELGPGVDAELCGVVVAEQM